MDNSFIEVVTTAKTIACVKVKDLKASIDKMKSGSKTDTLSTYKPTGARASKVEFCIINGLVKPEYDLALNLELSTVPLHYMMVKSTHHVLKADDPVELAQLIEFHSSIAQVAINLTR